MDKLKQLKEFLKAKQVPMTQGEIQNVIDFVSSIEADLTLKMEKLKDLSIEKRKSEKEVKDKK